MILFDFIKRVCQWIGKLLSKLKKILVPLLVIAAIAFTLGASIMFTPVFLAEMAALGITLPASIGGLGAALGCLGVSFLLAPKTTADTVSDGVEAVGDVLVTAASAVGDAVGAGVSSFSEAVVPALIIGVAFLAARAFFGGAAKKKNDEEEDGRTSDGAGQTTSKDRPVTVNAVDDVDTESNIILEEEPVWQLQPA